MRVVCVEEKGERARAKRSETAGKRIDVPLQEGPQAWAGHTGHGGVVRGHGARGRHNDGADT